MFTITPNSLIAENGYTRMKVKFTSTDGTVSTEQFYEVNSLEPVAVNKALTAADESWDKLVEKQQASSAPTESDILNPPNPVV